MKQAWTLEEVKTFFMFSINCLARMLDNIDLAMDNPSCRAHSSSSESSVDTAGDHEQPDNAAIGNNKEVNNNAPNNNATATELNNSGDDVIVLSSSMPATRKELELALIESRQKQLHDKEEHQCHS